MITNMDMVFIAGVMEDNMKVIGKKVSNMVKELIHVMVKEEKVFGKMEKRLNGSVRYNNT